MSEIITIVLKLISLLNLMLQLVPGEEERAAIKNTVAKAIDGDLGEDDVRDMLLGQMRSDGKATIDDWHKRLMRAALDVSGFIVPASSSRAPSHRGG